MEHYCKIHNCKFYKNEKDGRTWYSHKIKGEDGYCNEPKEDEKAVEHKQDAPKSTPEPLKETSKAILPMRTLKPSLSKDKRL